MSDAPKYDLGFIQSLIEAPDSPAVTPEAELRAKVARLEASIVEEKARVTEVEEWYADQVWELVTAQSDRDELRAALRRVLQERNWEFVCADDDTEEILLRLGDLERTDAGLRWKE